MHLPPPLSIHDEAGESAQEGDQHELIWRTNDQENPSLQQCPVIRLRLQVSGLRGHEAIDSLDDYATEPQLEERQMVRHYYDGAGRPRVQGGKDLRGSQSYPKKHLALYSVHTVHVLSEISVLM